jgi:hypothetical protein
MIGLGGRGGVRGKRCDAGGRHGADWTLTGR